MSADWVQSATVPVLLNCAATCLEIGASRETPLAPEKVAEWCAVAARLRRIAHDLYQAGHPVPGEGESPMSTTRQFVIWSWEHTAWWGPDRCGYTADLAKAGRYSHAEAADIVVGHIPAGEEVAFRIEEAEALKGFPRAPSDLAKARAR